MSSCAITNKEGVLPIFILLCGKSGKNQKQQEEMPQYLETIWRLLLAHPQTASYIELMVEKSRGYLVFRRLPSILDDRCVTSILDKDAATSCSNSGVASAVVSLSREYKSDIYSFMYS